jgi:hypothetical protein
MLKGSRAPVPYDEPSFDLLRKDCRWDFYRNYDNGNRALLHGTSGGGGAALDRRLRDRWNSIYRNLL